MSGKVKMYSNTLLEGPRLGYIILHCKLGVILELLFFIGRVDTIFVVPIYNTRDIHAIDSTYQWVDTISWCTHPPHVIIWLWWRQSVVPEQLRRWEWESRAFVARRCSFEPLDSPSFAIDRRWTKVGSDHSDHRFLSQGKLLVVARLMITWDYMYDES